MQDPPVIIMIASISFYQHFLLPYTSSGYFGSKSILCLEHLFFSIKNCFHRIPKSLFYVFILVRCDFIALELVNAQIKLTITQGDQYLTTKTLTNGKNLNDGVYHTIKIVKNGAVRIYVLLFFYKILTNIFSPC